MNVLKVLFMEEMVNALKAQEKMNAEEMRIVGFLRSVILEHA